MRRALEVGWVELLHRTVGQPRLAQALRESFGENVSQHRVQHCCRSLDALRLIEGADAFVSKLSYIHDVMPLLEKLAGRGAAAEAGAAQ